MCPSLGERQMIKVTNFTPTKNGNVEELGHLGTSTLGVLDQIMENNKMPVNPVK